MNQEIHDYIEKHFSTFREEREQWRHDFVEQIEISVKESINVTVNGKIDKLYRELIEKNKEQDEKLDKIAKGIEGFIAFHETSGKMVQGIFWLSKVMIALGAIFATAWAFFKFIVLAAIR